MTTSSPDERPDELPDSVPEADYVEQRQWADVGADDDTDPMPVVDVDAAADPADLQEQAMVVPVDADER